MDASQSVELVPVFSQGELSIVLEIQDKKEDRVMMADTRCMYAD